MYVFGFYKLCERDGQNKPRTFLRARDVATQMH